MRNPVIFDTSECSRLVPSWGGVGVADPPADRCTKPARHSGFSHLWYAGPPGMSIAMKVIPAIGKHAPDPDTGLESRRGGRPAHPCHIESLQAVPPQPTVLVRSQFANAQDKLRSNLNSYGSGHQSAPPQCGRGACGRVLRRVRHSRIFPLYQNKCCIVARKNDMVNTNIRSILLLN